MPLAPLRKLTETEGFRYRYDRMCVVGKMDNSCQAI